MVGDDTTGCEFVEGWLVAQVLGEGSYGEVRLLVHARTGASVALKSMRAASAEAGAAAREAALHRALRHAHVLRCLGARHHQDTHYMFLEYAQGGELFDRIEPDVGMSEPNARRYWRQILSGIGYLHGRGVAHRDIKPENLLLDAQDNIKISDFGMATLFRHGGAERTLNRKCGTLPYCAPEVLTATEAPYRAEPADLWSCGIVLLAMLAGELPWAAAAEGARGFASWCGGRARGRPWDGVAARALGLLRRLLARAPPRRAALPELLRHPWTADDGRHDDHLRAADREDRGWLSQPTRAGPAAGDALTASDMDTIISSSQPAAPDDLLLSTQNSPATQTQSVVQRLVRRMTRVWVSVDEAAALEALCAALRARGHTWQRVHPRVLLVSCGPRLRMRAWAVRAAAQGAGRGRVLLEFRRSRGCGLEFKRRFLELRAALAPVAAPAPADARLDLLAPPLRPARDHADADPDPDPDQPMDQS